MLPPAVAAASVPAPYILFFDHDAADVSAAGEEVLERVYRDYLREHPAQIMVTGHADRQGGERHNARLSGLRAETVRERLIAKGIPPQLLVTEALGERVGLVGTRDGAVEPQNRRVEIVLRRQAAQRSGDM